MTDKNYSRFPIKIYEIVLTTFLINSLFTVLLTIGETGQNILLFFTRSPLIAYAPFYLVFVYKILLENEELLLQSLIRYLTYLISICAIFLSIFQVQELVPILRMENMDVFQFGIEYNKSHLWHPLITAMILGLSLIIYWSLHKKRDRDFFYYLFFFFTLASIELGFLIALFPLVNSTFLDALSIPKRLLVTILVALSYFGLNAVLTLLFNPGSFGMLKARFRNKYQDRK